MKKKLEEVAAKTSLDARKLKTLKVKHLQSINSGDLDEGFAKQKGGGLNASKFKGIFKSKILLRQMNVCFCSTYPPPSTVF